MKRRIVIVGSGISGMAAAVILAKSGCEVTVLEQHHKPGGLMQTYCRGGCRFPTGIHSLGALNEGEILWRYFKYLGILDLIHLKPMDPNGFIECRFPGKTFCIPPNHEHFRDSLLNQFPEEQSGIFQFFNDMAALVQKFALYILNQSIEPLPSGLALVPLNTYLKRLMQSEQLKAILGCAHPLIGIHPDECPLYAYFLVLDSFLRGAYRIDESHESLAESFVTLVHNHGGVVRTSSHVTEMIYDSHCIKGVKLSNGEHISADSVIFTGHPRQLLALCKSPLGLRPAFRDRIGASLDTVGLMGMGIAWKNSFCPTESRDIMLFSSWDTGEQYIKRFIKTGETPSMIYCTAAAKSEQGRFPFLAICATHYDDWKCGDEQRTIRYSLEYYQKKKKAAELIMSVLRTQWPEYIDNMDVVDIFTPLTFQDYLLSPKGSAYGLSKSISNLSARVNAATRIKGLYLAGQSIILPGVLGTIISSVNACSYILGYEKLTREIAASSL